MAEETEKPKKTKRPDGFDRSKIFWCVLIVLDIAALAVFGFMFYTAVKSKFLPSSAPVSTIAPKPAAQTQAAAQKQTKPEKAPQETPLIKKEVKSAATAPAPATTASVAVSSEPAQPPSLSTASLPAAKLAKKSAKKAPKAKRTGAPSIVPVSSGAAVSAATDSAAQADTTMMQISSGSAVPQAKKKIKTRLKISTGTVVSAAVSSETIKSQPTQKKALPVVFRYLDSSAKSVAVAGGFTRWKPQKMRKTGDHWEAVLHIYPGTYQYYFEVDGAKVRDPLQPAYSEDKSSLIVQ